MYLLYARKGIQLSPKSHIMTYDEVFQIAKTFVDHGVTKIRLTGGEPLVRRDVDIILKKLATLPVELSITSNAVIIDRFIDILKECNIKNINVSLDSLDAEKFKEITRRNDFEKVYQNIMLLIEEGFNVKLNAVLINGFNDNEIIDFIKLTKAYQFQFDLLNSCLLMATNGTKLKWCLMRRLWNMCIQILIPIKSCDSRCSK